MAEVGSFTSRGHAEMAAGMLDAHGIPAVVRGDDAGGAAPHVTVGAHGYRLAVADADVADAEALLHGDDPAPTDGSVVGARIGAMQRPGTVRVLVAGLVLVVVVGVVTAALVDVLG